MRYLRTLGLIILDIILINFSYLLGLVLRFDGKTPEIYLNSYFKYAIYITLLQIVIFYFFGLYKTMWRYASIEEFLKVIGAVVFASVATAIVFITLIDREIPRSIYVMALLFETVLISGVRLFSRARDVFLSKGFKNGKKPTSQIKRTLIVGAGEAGVLALKELRKHKEIASIPVAFIDDAPEKKNKIIKGIPVVGTRHDIPKVVKDYKIDEILVAMPSIPEVQQKEILEIANKTKIKTKIIPGYYKVIEEDKFDLNLIREVEIEDLLGRDEIKLDDNSLSEFIENKVILVTGAGGSIGSELCRQIIKYNPKQLVMLDFYENNIYDIQNEIKRTYEDPQIVVLIENIREMERMEYVFDKYKPNVVFHAAAHKHVPLMEDSPVSAIKNNIFGTLNLLKCSDRFGIDKFVNISTDKAVNPTSIMGCTKRVCEIMVQTMNEKSKTDFVAVRFGNVLGSNGSVIPLFKNQIKEGGPVTVTHPDIIRYFMTITEACQLVMQAGAIAKGGEIFILDMGEPVKILDLAEKLIELSGFVPYEDIKIEFTGLRPGEKLYEELLLNKENSCKTEFEKIFIEKPYVHDTEILNKGLEKLEKDIHNNNKLELVNDLKYIVPNFTPDI
ncbi:polysaccharide biosynthesis protein [Miniphocaeibacter halophilus]|uniref:Polysaccharide biosynthesis protein n=1 Tax=Miniphocaeibacter halophilus TaxID=2931922 RepID=A0AC61MRR5_9FIRM|nr:nucleoside-diphosphate sugar epimerase/dehydratase [Miniphocaeibacter halophilus]QQK08008.1 polysaccharide biosynthesis protein [Miniphocaeibacter halophilus]